MNTRHHHNNASIAQHDPSDERDPYSPPNRKSTSASSHRNHPIQAAVRFAALLALPLMTGAPRALAKQVVTVEGVVETADDTLNEIYSRSIETPLDIGQVGTFLRFDIPDGKRLIIESIMVRVRVPAGQDAFVSIHAPFGVTAPIFLGAQSQDFAGIKYLVGTHPVKLRVDSLGTGEGQPDFAFSVNRNNSVGAGEFLVAVYGYLVDK